MSHHRRSQRHPCRLRVQLVDGAHARPAITNDVSVQGMFVRTDERWVPNALVRMHVTDPDDPRPIALLGIVTRSVTADETVSGPGVGVSLFGNGDAALKRWASLVRRAATATAGWTDSLDVENLIVPIRRRHTRRLCDLAVEFEHGDTTRLGRLCNASEGGVFVRAATLIDVGETIRMRVDHAGMPAELVGQTTRRHDSLDPLEKGIGVEVDRRSQSATRWAIFMTEHIPLQRSLPTFLPDLPPLAKRDVS
ncbi:MAG: hypothetical protein ACI9U2_003969 [Bradymonadia bacterium]|jgi:hypothetical protein